MKDEIMVNKDVLVCGMGIWSLHPIAWSCSSVIRLCCSQVLNSALHARELPVWGQIKSHPLSNAWAGFHRDCQGVRRWIWEDAFCYTGDM
ncbi:hypothetical protein CERSUDRAFT_88822 [Gelatoporia subvermispora B]|uniref:Uncharacterized protein n=1 Tax=Ceriporiopsis subvermispora (strain B) TaxID=914234 RepID=M2Q4F3_CERS8|nr:hypothetical protein CERSUDRAFT_88822 [Gelatoporia subvermispora B]